MMRPSKDSAGRLDLHLELKAHAAAAGMSLSNYLRAEDSPATGRIPVGDILALAASRGGGVPLERIIEAIDAGRR